MQHNNPFRNYSLAMFVAALKVGLPLNGWLITSIVATEVGRINDSTVDISTDEGNTVTIIKENRRGQRYKVTLKFQGL